MSEKQYYTCLKCGADVCAPHINAPCPKCGFRGSKTIDVEEKYVAPKTDIAKMMQYFKKRYKEVLEKYDGNTCESYNQVRMIK
jgi:hypothetical protein